MPAEMTDVAFRRGMKNALLCLIGVFAVVAILAQVVTTLTGQTWRDSVATSFAIFWVVVFLAFIANAIIGRQRRGEVLLDCGPHPTRILFLLNAGIFGFLALSHVFSADKSDLNGIASLIFWGSFCAYWVMMALGRLQLTENGIWQYWSLLKWDKIASYAWQGDTRPTLMLQTKSKYPILGRGALPVGPEHREAISELLERHVSKGD